MTRRDDVSPRTAAVRCVGACAALLVAYFAVPIHDRDGSLATALRTAITVVALIAVVLAIGQQVRRQLSRPGAPLGGLVVSLVAGLLLFALLDYAIAYHAPGEFSGLRTRLDALYFALSTVLTVGFGDISAKGQLARGVLCVQMLFNVVVLATAASLLARQIGARARARH
jgi:voltage-gated potassium channel